MYYFHLGKSEKAYGREGTRSMKQGRIYDAENGGHGRGNEQGIPDQGALDIPIWLWHVVYREQGVKWQII